MQLKLRFRIANCVLSALLTGCGGSGEGLDQNGSVSTEDSIGSVLTADFASIQANVFTPVCTTCHAGATAPLGLRLDADNSYALLVGVASVEVPSLQRVHPGDPNSSYLIQKLAGIAAVGQRMPFNGPYLPQSTIDVIKQWIANGAQRSLAIATPDKFAQLIARGLQITTTSPLADSTVAASPAQIIIGFDRELDNTLVNDSTVQLERLVATTSGPAVAQEAAAVQPIAISLRVPSANTRTLIVAPNTALRAGNYRLTLRGNGGGALAGLDTLPLNSGIENAPGQNSELKFTVQVQP